MNNDSRERPALGIFVQTAGRLGFGAFYKARRFEPCISRKGFKWSARQGTESQLNQTPFKGGGIASVNHWFRRVRVPSAPQTKHNMEDMKDINRVELLGHVGSVSYFDSRIPPRYANISLSTTVPYNDSNYEVTWHG